MDARVQDLRYFVAVAEELSFTRAADRLFVSQPALSKQVRQLERALRVTLFERDRRSVRLTAAGQALLPRARDIIAMWEDARAAVAAGGTTLRVGFQTQIGRGLIPATTARLREVLAEWRLLFRQIPWDDPAVGLASGEVDVAVAWLPVPDVLEWKVVSSEERWVAMPPGHRLAGLDTVPFESLVDEPVIALPASAGPARDFWLGAAQRSRPAVVATEATTAEEAFEGVAAGLGIVLVAAGNAEIYRREDVVCRPVSGLPPSELAVVWRAGDDREAVRVFAEVCRMCLCDQG
ncbi:LysR family transcriptional regulator [Amycolatopsis deserti]|uniref:LysR family transcriptional regulator n=1 Tax=Amycolatopsis deserti TaxID=185696 RepID=A0ABQ3JJ29_9PSEU|nr:LysR family transcriptional regulator [Amycolatopsis deserti]GHF28957.1 LysR family transcriptional regulator [Amycolatopsis deserti]